jgi:hypothetical protein
MLCNILMDPRPRYLWSLGWLQLQEGGEYRPLPFEGIGIAG